MPRTRTFIQPPPQHPAPPAPPAPPRARNAKARTRYLLVVAYVGECCPRPHVMWEGPFERKERALEILASLQRTHNLEAGQFEHDIIEVR